MTKAVNVDVDKAISSIRSLAWRANSLAGEEFDRHMGIEAASYDADERNMDLVSDAIESAFLQLLTLTEALQLPSLYDSILATFKEASRVGLSKFEQFEDVSGWAYWSEPIQRFAEAIDSAFGSREQPTQAVNATLLSVIENLQTAITDKACFKAPKGEPEVHDRIEMVLKCFYTDLMRKPPLAKSVTGFVPDSGIPSLSTLLEYKYLSVESKARAIANEILADTRGYRSSEWNNIIFVIYETRRFKTIHEWRALLRECGVPDSIQVVLLHGEVPESDESSTSPKKKAQGASASREKSR